MRSSFLIERGGGAGIRTLGGVAPTTVFETAPFSRSGTPPYEGHSYLQAVFFASIELTAAAETKPYPVRSGCPARTVFGQGRLHRCFPGGGARLISLLPADGEDRSHRPSPDNGDTPCPRTSIYPVRLRSWPPACLPLPPF